MVVEGSDFHFFQLVDGIYLVRHEINMLEFDFDFGIDDAVKGLEDTLVNGKVLFGDKCEIIAVCPEDEGFWKGALQLCGKFFEQLISFGPAVMLVVLGYILEVQKVQTGVSIQVQVVEDDLQVIFVEKSCQLVVEEVGESFLLKISHRQLTDGRGDVDVAQHLDGSLDHIRMKLTAA